MASRPRLTPSQRARLSPLLTPSQVEAFSSPRVLDLLRADSIARRDGTARLRVGRRLESVSEQEIRRIADQEGFGGIFSANPTIDINGRQVALPQVDYSGLLFDDSVRPFTRAQFSELSRLGVSDGVLDNLMRLSGNEVADSRFIEGLSDLERSELANSLSNLPARGALSNKLQYVNNVVGEDPLANQAGPSGIGDGDDGGEGVNVYNSNLGSKKAERAFRRRPCKVGIKFDFRDCMRFIAPDSLSNTLKNLGMPKDFLKGDFEHRLIKSDEDVALHRDKWAPYLKIDVLSMMWVFVLLNYNMRDTLILHRGGTTAKKLVEMFSYITNPSMAMSYVVSRCKEVSRAFSPMCPVPGSALKKLCHDCLLGGKVEVYKYMLDFDPEVLFSKTGVYIKDLWQLITGIQPAKSLMHYAAKNLSDVENIEEVVLSLLNEPCAVDCTCKYFHYEVYNLEDILFNHPHGESLLWFDKVAQYLSDNDYEVELCNLIAAPVGGLRVGNKWQSICDYVDESSVVKDRYEKSYEEVDGEPHFKEFGLFMIDIDYEGVLRRPFTSVLYDRVGGEIVWSLSNKKNYLCSSCEIFMALKVGWVVKKWHFGVFIYCDLSFKPVISELYDKRCEFKNFKEKIIKLLINSYYGKMGQKDRPVYVFGTKEKLESNENVVQRSIQKISLDDRVYRAKSKDLKRFTRPVQIAVWNLATARMKMNLTYYKLGMFEEESDLYRH